MRRGQRALGGYTPPRTTPRSVLEHQS
jgi:hypothetical protein